MTEIKTIVSELTDVFQNRNISSVVVYRGRRDDQASVSFSASMEELLDMAVIIALVAAREATVDLGLDPCKAVELVRAAVDDKINTMQEGFSIRGSYGPG